jgi:hypothetical protein
VVPVAAPVLAAVAGRSQAQLGPGGRLAGASAAGAAGSVVGPGVGAVVVAAVAAVAGCVALGLSGPAVAIAAQGDDRSAGSWPATPWSLT